MRFFRPEVEAVLMMLGGGILLGLIVLPAAWAYEQRQQARAWQRVACAYRIREISIRAPLVSTIDPAGDPCRALSRLGLELDVQRIGLQRVSGR